MAKTAVEFETPKLNLVPEKFPELKLPKFDLDALFSAQKANLAAAKEVQTVLVDAAEAVARVQYGYIEQAVADMKAALGTKQLAKPNAALADLKVVAEKAVAVAEEVVDCPSSDDLRQRPGLGKGGSGSRMEAMRPGRDAASGDWRWSGV